MRDMKARLGMTKMEGEPLWDEADETVTLEAMLRVVAVLRSAGETTQQTIGMYAVALRGKHAGDLRRALTRVARAELQPWEPRWPELGLMLRVVAEEAEQRLIREEGERERRTEGQTTTQLEAGR